MFDSAQRLSVVLEFGDEENDWAAVAMLIDERGRRGRATLARFPTREKAAAFLDSLYAALPELARRHT
ncbi:MAG: hypothetical protein ACE5GS_03400 [Kiloniellaceae bacterium]